MIWQGWQSGRWRLVHLAHVEPSARKLNSIRNSFSPSNSHSPAVLPAPTWLTCAHRLRRGKSEKNGQTGLTIPWGGMVGSTKGSDGLVALPRPRHLCRGRTIRDTENPASRREKSSENLGKVRQNGKNVSRLPDTSDAGPHAQMPGMTPLTRNHAGPENARPGFRALRGDEPSRF
jgi:hypothetical protein